tara:strand:- start:899 stop:1906 length:1008 start_codon:yes stop_codon:yes gene_type:complete
MNLKNKKVLITGADGFIGSHLVDQLLKQNCAIRAMTLYNSFNSWGWLDSFDKKKLKQIEVYSGDVRDKKSIMNACRGVDVIFHLASLIAIPHSYHSPYAYLETNALGALNLYESCLDLPIEKIIHTSTSEVYGESAKIPIDEKSKIIAKSPYAATKIAADQIAYSYFSSFNLPISIIRPFNTYGPRQSNRAIIPTIISQILTKRFITLGSLYPTRDFTYIEDTVNAFVKIGKSDKTNGEIVNIGSGFEISIESLVELIQDIMGTNIEVKTDTKRVRPKSGEVYRLKSGIKLAKEIANWEPKYKGKVGLKEGLKKTIDWFSDEKNLEHYKTDIYNV